MKEDCRRRRRSEREEEGRKGSGGEMRRRNEEEGRTKRGRGEKEEGRGEIWFELCGSERKATTRSLSAIWDLRCEVKRY